MGASGFPDPGTVVLRFAALGHALFVARAVARNNIEELLPIEFCFFTALDLLLDPLIVNVYSEERNYRTT